MEVPAWRDLFEHRYYRLNKMFLKWIALWPYQTIRDRTIIFTIWFLIGVGQIVVQTIAIVKHRDDWDFLIVCVGTLVFDAFCVTKYFTSVFNLQKLLRLLNGIRAHWDVQARDYDASILHEYAEKGRKMTVTYADLPILCIVVGYMNCFSFVTPPAVAKVIDIVLRNGTEPGEFPTPVDFLVIDVQKYYFYIALYSAMAAFLAYSVCVGCDCMFMVYIQHCCGLYVALGRNLERVIKNERSSTTEKTPHAVNKPNMNYKQLPACIDRHNEAIEYCELIEASYSWSFFGIVGLNMLMISVTGLEIVMRTANPEQTVRFIVCNIVSMAHLFVLSYMAQDMMDHSIKIRSDILNAEWYKLPLKTQKVLLFMIMRCNVPCQLTAGKICVMSIENFGMFLKTSLSYFTILRAL